MDESGSPENNKCLAAKKTYPVNERKSKKTEYIRKQTGTLDDIAN